MAVTSTRTDVAAAFFNLDFRDPEPSPTSSREPRSQPYRTNPSLQQPTFPFLSLPAEIRIQIYDLLLVSRNESPSHTTKTSTKPTSTIKPIPLHQPPSPRPHTHTHTISPSILLTNKQISTESLPILYTQNTFTLHSSHPTPLHTFITQIGPQNLLLLRSLSLFIPWQHSTNEVWPWVILLTHLAEKATGLRFLEIGWGANCASAWNLKPGAEERGLGDNLLFVHAVAGFRGLGCLRVKGFFGVRWPGYLRGELGGGVGGKGTRVEVVEGFPVEGGEKGHGDWDGDWVRDVNRENERRVRAYQAGTEGLVP
ncbi:hypothetical protein BO78DRAFT_430460 [Aspergillus sclerotiicarbonarius CBS 121057]|uniref:Uncharacterized protein n=1 Tax=Aspergillus sclerotiicarbonarius (strain CBS 121057 / IBT 28362) TaxID=1448318 RepID=A0A319EP44_ASPSB|nr:hypothetical protein BO78DRAFT_430460 [Aspergillus sclerotiicarbonarius CBS 121057]